MSRGRAGGREGGSEGANGSEGEGEEGRGARKGRREGGREGRTGRNLVELSIVSRLCRVETVSKLFIESGMGWRRFRCTRVGDRCL